jgi:hypothetical protein
MIITYIANYSRVQFGTDDNYREYTHVTPSSLSRLQRLMWRKWHKGEVVPGWFQGGTGWLVIEKKGGEQ